MAVIDGMGKLLRRFAALDRVAQGVTLTAAAEAGASAIREEARRRAPRGATGTLADEGIDIESGRTTRTESSVNVGYDKTSAFYGTFQELGTRFHSAQPHLRPAVDSAGADAVEATGRVFRLAVDAARRA